MRAKVKKVKVSLANDRDVAEMFNQMLGEGTVNLPIAYPRYKNIGTLCERTITVFKLLADSPMMKIPDFDIPRKETLAFCEISRKYIAVIFNVKSPEAYAPFYKDVPNDITAEFAEAYKAMKQSKFVKSIISIANNLHQYRANFIDKNAVDHRFINDISGVEWSPFPFPFNIKDILYHESTTKTATEFLMVILNRVYTFSLAIYDEVRTPDIDIDQFVEVIAASIEELQKRQGLDRCDKAFKKIKESVMLLKTNFNGYYRNFIETQDKTQIMQDFIIDVSNKTQADPELTRQFRKIIEYYQEVAKQSSVKDSGKINSMFEKLAETFKEFDDVSANLKPDTGIQGTESSEEKK